MGRIRSINSGPNGYPGQPGVNGLNSDEYKREIIIRKWTPVVENNIPTINKKIIEYCALYCEWYLSIDENYTKNSAGEDLNNRLEEIKKKNC